MHMQFAMQSLRWHIARRHLEKRNAADTRNHLGICQIWLIWGSTQKIEFVRMRIWFWFPVSYIFFGHLVCHEFWTSPFQIRKTRLKWCAWSDRVPQARVCCKDAVFWGINLAHFWGDGSFTPQLRCWCNFRNLQTFMVVSIIWEDHCHCWINWTFIIIFWYMSREKSIVA